LFAVSDGLKLNEKNLQNNSVSSAKRIDLHIISLGSPEMMLEIWLKSNRTGLLIRYCDELMLLVDQETLVLYANA